MIILKIVLVGLLLVLLYNLIGAMMTTRALMKIKQTQLLGIMREWEDFSRRSEAEYQARFYLENTPNKACSRRGGSQGSSNFQSQRYLVRSDHR